MKLYRIAKGRHGSLHFRPFICKRFLKYRVLFTNSCLYNLGNHNQLDINKLFGLAFGIHHHRNSVRVGWRTDGVSDKISLFAYYYVNGERKWSPLCEVEPNRLYDLSIDVVPGAYVFEVEDVQSSASFTYTVSRPRVPWPGYYLYPYFGGNETAPHDMTIMMKEMSRGT